MPDRAHRSRLIVASNRLPVVLTRDSKGTINATTGSGGLVSALLPVLRNRGGIWVGWPGLPALPDNINTLLEQTMHQAGYRLEPVALTEDEHHRFYHGFSNEIIWPLFHDLQSLCNFNPSYWDAYQAVNRKFAEVIAGCSRDNDFIWIHDYHLMNTGQELRRLGVTAKTAFFLHTPFPPLDIFVKLPWRFQLLHALLEYDLIGFQTLRDRHNFTLCARTLIKKIDIQGKGQVLTATVDEHSVRIGHFPISIDFNSFVKRTADREIADKVSELGRIQPGRQLILGIDRLDYTKGIPHRLEAFRNALLRYPDMRERLTLIQVVVPSREDIPQYHDLKMNIEQLIGEINGQFTQPGSWVPIHYIFRSLTRTELLAYYRAAQMALVTPLKDGMNLVAKEYCACSNDEDSVLILSEFAGAAAQMQKGALLVNPYDIEGVADAIHQAFIMDLDERRTRMRRLRRSIRNQDIFWWVDSFLRAAIAQDMAAFPVLADYVPRDDIGDTPL
ncbi:MAG: trehalose-6-phosphate synthase [Gammaproteobacteria bacterium]|nr:trehalose-6-phosphate synthase [Gammaproteobacteria bacterium]